MGAFFEKSRPIHWINGIHITIHVLVIELAAIVHQVYRPEYQKQSCKKPPQFASAATN